MCGRFQRNTDEVSGIPLLPVKKTNPEFQNGSVHPVLHGLGARKLLKTKE
jgi:hypothetical protein